MALEEIRGERIRKLEALKGAGIDPYPATAGRRFRVADILSSFEGHESSGESLSVAGRVMAKREQGALTFADLHDETAKIQLILKADLLDEISKTVLENLDIGDIVEVSGRGVTTKRGEKSIEASKLVMLTKTILPLPDKWHGLVDIEERLRKRYLDLLMNPEEREVFVKKSKFWQATREFLLKEGFLEVETPVLEQIPGGADAEPFVTHHNALDVDFYLRISPELHLKRLLAGGYERVFEIGRIFRNEGIDKEHLQDYTQMEAYWAYADYEMMMALVERMYKMVIQAVLGGLTQDWQGIAIDWGSAWPKLDYYDLFKKETGLDLSKASESDLQSYAESEGIDTEAHLGRGRLIDVIFKKKVRSHLVQPGFLVLPPIDVEPLAKRSSKDPNRVERFQVVACGSELGKGFSELNDPLDQRARFEEQQRLREAGDAEAQMMDLDFVEALEYGMPPAAGFGFSERLFSVLIGRPVRETVFFPLMRPRRHD